MTTTKRIPRGTLYSDTEITRIKKAYESNKGIKNGWLVKLADDMGRPYGSVSAVGSKLGLGNKNRSSRNQYSFSDKEKKIIRQAYMKNVNRRGWLDDLSIHMGRDKHSVCRCARRMGLTTNSRGWEDGQHPKGMSGKTHTKDLRNEISRRVKRMWEDPTSKFNGQEFRKKRSAIASRNMRRRIRRHPSSVYSYAKKGWLEFEGGRKRYFFRSEWEMNCAKYLDMEKKNGEIVDWWYEVDTFEFSQIDRGVRSYTPDFKVKLSDGQTTYFEVKGWMDAKSRIKLTSMAKYYPSVSIVVIDEPIYRQMRDSGRFLIDELAVYELDE